MTTPNEHTLVERPLLDYLEKDLSYTRLSAGQVLQLRGGKENRVILRDRLVAALVKLNDIPESAARSMASELEAVSDNEKWLRLLRGEYSKQLAGEKQHRPIKIIDLDDPLANDFVVTNQLTVHGHSHRICDVAIYVNGIPLVVIEAKSAIGKQDVFDAIDDIAVYESELPRLFQPNLFNIATNGLALRYGPTRCPKEFWATWRDPWPRKASEFESEPMRQGLWSLLEKRRLIDLLAHFVVFEKDANSGTTTKKMCRYQQFRAVNKIVQRVGHEDHKRGLIWHTQGSGKSLTMVFTTLKLKFHRGVESETIGNPNILIVTDRKDLDAQITKTFQDCGIPNPVHAGSIPDLQAQIAGTPSGKVVLSTIFKAYGSTEPIAQSGDWIILVDEAHRTQEKDLGAYLRTSFPDARMFGFTGTPVKTNDLDTRANFGAEGEDYLDRYGIEDAVRDGATVPICYTSRMPLWDLDAAKLDVLFDQEFATLPDEVREVLKARGVTRGDLSRFEPRIALITYDIWTHFKLNVAPDKMKAQIVAVDRKACTIYKRCLDDVIAAELMAEGLSEERARAQADGRSVCVYSPGGKEDLKPGNEDLSKYYLDEVAEKEAIRKFKDPDDPLSFLIVCNKLLTGFDAPIEQAMYLDSALTQHNLLQAIARTNRRYGSAKDHGVIVDYVGVTRDLKDSLSSYKPEDVEGAMAEDSELVGRLKTRHKTAMAFISTADRTGDPEEVAKKGVAAIGTEDVWYEFRTAASEFLKALAAVGSNPVRLIYTKDTKDAQYIASVIAYGRLQFEQEAEIDFKAHSEKIRGMLKEHLKVTGLETLLTLPSISDPDYWRGLIEEPDESDIQTAALKKASALKKTLVQKAASNPAQYTSLSERIQQLIDQFQKKQKTAAELYEQQYEVAIDLLHKEVEYEELGLDEETYGIYAVLRSDTPKVEKQTDGLRFSEKALSDLVTSMKSWKHERSLDPEQAFKLGNGEESVARGVVELLEEIAAAPLPEALKGNENGGKRYLALPKHVVRAPNRLVRLGSAGDDASPWRMMVLFGVEPLLLKVLGYLEPKLAEDIVNKRTSLASIIQSFSRTGRIAYENDLTNDEFEGTEVWPNRSSYDNALRDVVGIRHDQAHAAPEVDERLWRSALVVMLGVVEKNADELRATLADIEKADLRPRKTGDEATADLSEEDLRLRDAAMALTDIYREAPINWHLKTDEQKKLRKSARLTMKALGYAREVYDSMVKAVAEYAKQHFAKTPE